MRRQLPASLRCMHRCSANLCLLRHGKACQRSRKVCQTTMSMRKAKITYLYSYLHKLQAHARKANAQSRGPVVTTPDHVSQNVDFVAFTGTDNWVSGGQGQYCTAG